METVPATVSKHSVDPKCIPKYFIPNAAYHGVTSVYDVLTPQQFQDSITTTPPATQAVSTQKKHKLRVSRRQPSKSSGRIIGLGWNFGQKNKTTMNGPDIEEVDE
jgi:hypothetical protein